MCITSASKICALYFSYALVSIFTPGVSFDCCAIAGVPNINTAIDDKTSNFFFIVYYFGFDFTGTSMDLSPFMLDRFPNSFKGTNALCISPVLLYNSKPSAFKASASIASPDSIALILGPPSVLIIEYLFANSSLSILTMSLMAFLACSVY